MGLTIFLIVLALICIIGSFFVTEKMENRLNQSEPFVSEEALASVLKQNKQTIEASVTESIERVKEQTIEDAVQQLNRLTNEKIMAVDEFSDTVLEKINQNHSEVIFMYNMLNEKEKELKQSMAAETLSARKPSTERKEKKREGTRRQSKAAESKSAAFVKQENSAISMSQVEKEQEAGHRMKILKAYENGESVTEIAKKLNLGKGEVKLIIDLYQGAKK